MLAAPPPAEVALCDGAADLDGILALQRANLEVTVGAEVAARDGFVTVVHDRDVLARMHALAPSIVARAGGEVVAYALAMAMECEPFLPVLAPMFRLFAGLEHRGAPLLARRLYVMGQICVAPAYRGSGLFDALYAAHRQHYADRFDLLATEVAVRNGRSLRAHGRVGFREITRYRDDTDHWVVLGLELDR